VELGLIIIYKLQFQVVSLLENQTSDHGAKQIRASALMQGLPMVILFFPYYRRLFITRYKMGPISTDSPEFEAAEKGVKSRLKNS
jgi:succinate dehydrogenase / fumarate reductase flavoprotein subunit